MPTLSDAIAAIKAGRRDEARDILTRILSDDARNITALLWMTEVAKTADERRKYLSRILEIDPNNPHARKGLELLGKADEQPPWMAATEYSSSQPKKNAPISETLRKSGWTPAQKVLLFAIIALVAVVALSLVAMLQQPTVSPSINAPTEDSGSQENKPVSPTARPRPTSTRPRPTPTKIPIAIEKDLIISNWTCTEQTYGDSVKFEATIKNVSQRTYRFVRIRIAMFDKASKTVNTSTWYIESDVLFPGASSSFTGYLDAAGGSSCGIAVDSATLDD